MLCYVYFILIMKSKSLCLLMRIKRGPLDTVNIYFFVDFLLKYILFIYLFLYIHTLAEKNFAKDLFFLQNIEEYYFSSNKVFYLFYLYLNTRLQFIAWLCQKYMGWHGIELNLLYLFLKT